MITTRRLAVLLVAAASLSATAFAQTPQAPAPASKPPINIDKAGLAIQGYDPVAYQTVGKPTKGAAQFVATHEGATYRFASAAHKDAFIADPAKYVPQYGGYCAYAVANGYTAVIDPTAWRVVDGKLYLNYNAAVAKTWLGKANDYIKSGDANWRDWPKLRKG